MGILKLPVEVLGLILAYVPESSLFMLKGTSKRLKHVVEWSKRLTFELDVTVTCSVDDTQIILQLSPTCFKYISLKDVEEHRENGLGAILEWVSGIDVFMNMDVPEGDIISHGAIDKVMTILFDVMESLNRCNLKVLLLGFYVFVDVAEHWKLVERINKSPLDFRVPNMVVAKDRDDSLGQVLEVGHRVGSLEVLMNDTSGSNQSFAYLDIRNAESLKYISFQWTSTQRLADSQLDGVMDFLMSCKNLEEVGFVGGLRPSFVLPYQHLINLPSSVTRITFNNCLVLPGDGGTCSAREIIINDSKLDLLSWYSFPNLTSMGISSNKSLMPLTSVLHTLERVSLTCSTLDIFMTPEFINSPLVEIAAVVWGATEEQIMRLALLPNLQTAKLVISFFGQTISMDEQYEILDRSVNRLLDLGPSKFDLRLSLNHTSYWSIDKSDSDYI
ncbi:hypothetical protein TRICI_001303 [Trichomonascus ciferrii]|uniref:F-box domain-containing protein n=1 Tax=Trichomonascus ciferrii TaxID=44093 RepID=A0A642VA22_9ASCO|nr:hypothetical protein TRICI_001303 [Trichomonascus ciferrii]